MLLAITEMIIITCEIVVAHCFDKDKEIIGLIALAGLVLGFIYYYQTCL